MADPVLDDPIPNLDTLPIPPLDATFFFDDIDFSDNFDDDDLFNFDFNFDDLDLPSEDTQPSIDSIIPSSDCNYPEPNSVSPEFSQVSDDTKHPNFSCEKTSDVVVNISGERSFDDVSYLNVSSSDSRDSCQESGHNDFGVSRVLNYASPFSQGSDDCVRSVDQRIQLEESGKNHLLKRKKEDEDGKSVFKRTIKSRRSNESDRRADVTDQSNVTDDGEKKRKARLIRNRESAHLSRQKKKQYVEELQDKVRAMHSTIQDLNAKISYIVAENTTLRQQMNSGAMAPPPVPGLYSHPAMATMGYPWTPYPPYFVKPQGSQVPLVPIPRLKPHIQHNKTTMNGESKKKEGKSKTKKVASVSFLGLLFFILFFGGLVHMVNVKHGRLPGTLLDRSDYNENISSHQHHGSKVLVVNGTDHDSRTRFSGKNLDTRNRKNFDSNFNCHQGHVAAARANIKQSNSEDFALSGNVSDHLVASLYVPRNDKLVKIDGNLIIHSVLASEKATISHEDGQTKSGKNSLVVASSLAPAISFPGVGQNIERLPHLYRSTAGHKVLASGKDNLNSTPQDGEVQQWFLEGLGGPVLRSGMCTEVFQFDVSPTPGAITPATSVTNISVGKNRNSTRLNKGRNRRILQGLPIPLAGSANNISQESASSNSKENSNRNSSHSPMVVSVLVDPREVGDFNDDGILRTKPLSRIFVVVLLDSVKYVTYSSMLPFKGSNLLVTA